MAIEHLQVWKWYTKTTHGSTIIIIEINALAHFATIDCKEKPTILTLVEIGFIFGIFNTLVVSVEFLVENFGRHVSWL